MSTKRQAPSQPADRPAVAGSFEVTNLHAKRKERVTAVVAQVKLRLEDFRQVDGLSYVANIEHVKRKVGALLATLEPHSPDLIAFPELAIPEEVLPDLQAYSRGHDVIIVAGSHYANAAHGRIAVCPVYIAGDRYDVHKLNPSPFQLSMFEGDSLCAGTINRVFKGTAVGNFAVLVCSDFLHDEMLTFVNRHDLDFLIVPSCQKDSDRYFTRFSEQVRDSRNGLYALFPNLFVPRFSEGRSGVIGVVDDIYINSAISRRITDAKPQTKLWEASSGNDFIVAEFSLTQKKPPKVKTKTATPNVIIKRTRSHVPRRRDSSDGSTYKLIAFDLDGTLIRGAKFSWVKLWEHVGDTSGAKWKGLLRAFRTGEITYDGWCNAAVDQFKAAGVTRQQIADIARQCRLTANFHAGMERLRSLGFVTGIISGGVDVFLEELVPNYKDLFDFVYINDLLFRANGQLAGVEPTRYDFEGKYDALELECDERGLSVNEAIFVGDQFNDDEILKRAGHAIVYSENDDSVGLTAHRTITEDDLLLLVQYVEQLNCRTDGD